MILYIDWMNLEHSLIIITHTYYKSSFISSSIDDYMFISNVLSKVINFIILLGAINSSEQLS